MVLAQNRVDEDIASKVVGTKSDLGPAGSQGHQNSLEKMARATKIVKGLPNLHAPILQRTSLDEDGKIHPREDGRVRVITLKLPKGYTNDP